jgi:MoaA/NifB/PqqE/SkfB family radical SAM enzyme
MDLAVILTYRCSARCSMCHVWKHPTRPEAEVTPATLAKVPSGFDFINLSGGEPTLRRDLPEIVDILYPKACKLEISTNGLHGDRLVPLVKKYPDLKIRISIEGLGEKNDVIRGEKNGFEKKMATLGKLIEAGGQDLGLATTFQDENVDEIVKLYRLSQEQGVEFATSALHNGFQFFKSDNGQYDRVRVARKVEDLITEMLKSGSVKTWFRAYLNLGLMGKILGQDRLIPCTAATDFAFVDPWSDVYACNVRPDLKLGNLAEQSWDEIFHGDVAAEKRREVAACPQNCWMVGSAKTAMRNPKYAKLPKWEPLRWVLINKIRATLGLRIPFERYVDYDNVHRDEDIPKRISHLETWDTPQKSPRVSTQYAEFDQGFFNR